MDAKSMQADRQMLLLIQRQKDDLRSEIEELKLRIKEVEDQILDLDGQDSGDESEKDMHLVHMKRAFRLFNNESAKKGVKHLIENKIIEEDAQAIAKYLFQTDGLNKTKIGEYLGENDKLNLEVLKAFSEQHNFTGQDFDKALRAYLWSFRLPGEAQKIDRIMESFAKRFCECNAATFSNPDTCYVLAFSTIMLNTSLHNPSVKNRPTIETFISMNRGIDGGKDLPNELLTTLFDSIKNNPFKIPDGGDDNAFVSPEKSGWLTKEGGGHKTWKRRWFTLCNNCLYYFETENDKTPKGTIPLENLEVKVLNEHKKPNVFEICPETVRDEDNEVVKAAKVKDGKLVQGKHTSYKIQADTKPDMEDWIMCIRAAMTKGSIYELYRMRKENVSNN